MKFKYSCFFCLLIKYINMKLSYFLNKTCFLMFVVLCCLNKCKLRTYCYKTSISNNSFIIIVYF